MKYLPRLLPSHPNRPIALGFVTAMVLLAVGFGLSFYNYNRYDQASGRVEHAYRVISALDGVLLLMKDVETGVRGYVISGDSLFLTPYREARLRLPTHMTELHQLLVDNAEQRQQSARLDQLIEATLVISDRQLTSYPQQPTAATGYLRAGKTRMDDIRRQIAGMVNDEQQQMQYKIDGVSKSFGNILLVTLSLSILTFVTLIFLYNLLEAELIRRQQNEDKLRGYEDDLTDRIRQLESSNEELERFAFVASHDLQEPLRKIQSFGSLLVQRYQPVLGEDGVLFMGKIIMSAERMSKLIKDLLNFSRLTAQAEPVRLVKMADIIQEILDEHEVSIQRTRADVQVGRMPVIQGVPGQIGHLFANLISNALKFTHPGTPPCITIRAEAVDGSLFPELIPGRKYYQFIITDNGIGLDEKYADHIFRVFQRLHGRNTYEGTGIGLAICKKVVMNHKGFITVRSTPGNGATFIILLPEKQTNDLNDRSLADEVHSYTAG